MAKPETDHDTSNSNKPWNLTSRVRVNLPESVRDNLGALRRLHHLVVDIMADRGFVKTLADDAEMRLEVLSTDMAAHYVMDLLGQAYSPRRRSKKTKKSKKSAKRERK
ncbi:MAG: hypothetical protein IIC01_11825 [Planctomycetes bacterium]|nr:hypothetical protein [Planctomycetota bacterium]